VDTPTSELNTSALVREVEAVAARHAATVKATIIAGEDLLQHGLGALYGVGKAATAPPALAVLEYTPRNAAKSDVKLSLVGKGIVYDTGGLCVLILLSFLSLFFLLLRSLDILLHP
jgi:probable aminopeptidase NPEPL1